VEIAGEKPVYRQAGWPIVIGHLSIIFDKQLQEFL
jgi:hypothetical protein